MAGSHLRHRDNFELSIFRKSGSRTVDSGRGFYAYRFLVFLEPHTIEGERLRRKYLRFESVEIPRLVFSPSLLVLVRKAG